MVKATIETSNDLQEKRDSVDDLVKNILKVLSPEKKLRAYDILTGFSLNDNNMKAG